MTAAACPSWCDGPEGHEYDLETDGLLSARIHGRLFGSYGTTAAEMQHLGIVGTDGVERPEADMPAIAVYIGGDGHDCRLTDPQEARDLATSLMAAAAELEAWIANVEREAAEWHENEWRAHEERMRARG